MTQQHGITAFAQGESAPRGGADTLAPRQIHTDRERLWTSLMEVAQIGRFHDEQTGTWGVNRQTFTDEDRQGRELVISWMRAAGLSVSHDAIGNIIATRPGTDPDAAPVMTGSHIDSVATAGAFDGCLGVLAGLECMRTMNDLGIQTRAPICLVVWSEEEGVRFGSDKLGSSVAAGRIALDEAYERRDANGLSLGDEIRRQGFAGSGSVLDVRPKVYVECHIEQGPLLKRANTRIGVVTGIQAISWIELVVTGKASHGGTTPNDLRSDAVIGAAKIVSHLQEMVESGDFGEFRAHVGVLHVEPNLPNVIASKVTMTVDLRNTDDADMERCETELERFAHEVLGAGDDGVRVESMASKARTSCIHFDADVEQSIAGSADLLGLSHERIMSGAGHDAGEVAAGVPTAMIFVQSENDGISHSPREYSTPEACHEGADVLLNTLISLADNTGTL